MPSSNEFSSALSLWQAALLLGPVLATAVAACLAGPGVTTAAAWRGARWACGLALACAALSFGLVLPLAGSLTFSQGHALRADALGALFMLLVSFVGWVIVRYSQPYLQGERAERHYVRWLMATLASVGVVVVTNHLLVMALAWTATSLALHRLLTFYGDRPAAVLAAHKKRIVGRAADLCMLAACGLLFAAFDTLQIDGILAHAGQDSLPLTAHVAVFLLACAALLKCAQLPFHGWLIQVMEAPTPVSALLHAGVVNLGGFVLLRFAPLVADVPAAQLVLVVLGTFTAVVAALVMSTRISVKVMLAWSTCAQMGFMLMQCGLGVWEMALLHLVAHSLYKAHAFLAAGGAVRRAMRQQLTPPAPVMAWSSGWTRAVLAGPVPGLVLGLGMTLAAGASFAALVPSPAPAGAIWVLAGIFAMALVPLLQGQAFQLGRLWLPALGCGAFAVALAYFALHSVFAALLPAPVEVPSLQWPLSIFVALAFGALFLLQSFIAAAPQGPWLRRLYPWFYGGLFLDEKFNRIAFAIWPPPRPAAPGADITLPAKGPVVANGVRA